MNSLQKFYLIGLILVFQISCYADEQADNQLLSATFHGDISSMQEAIDAGANINTQKSWCIITPIKSPLSHAIDQDNLLAIRFLLNKGADITHLHEYHKETLAWMLSSEYSPGSHLHLKNMTGEGTYPTQSHENNKPKDTTGYAPSDETPQEPISLWAARQWLNAGPKKRLLKSIN